MWRQEVLRTFFGTAPTNIRNTSVPSRWWVRCPQRSVQVCDRIDHVRDPICLLLVFVCSSTYPSCHHLGQIDDTTNFPPSNFPSSSRNVTSLEDQSVMVTVSSPMSLSGGTETLSTVAVCLNPIRTHGSHRPIFCSETWSVMVELTVYYHCYYCCYYHCKKEHSSIDWASGCTHVVRNSSSSLLCGG